MDEKGREECPESSSTLLLYLYGEAADPEAFEAHLESCEECSRLLAHHRATLEKYRDFPPGADYFDLEKAAGIVAKKALLGRSVEIFPRWRRIFRPLATFAVAATLIIAFSIPMRFITIHEQGDIARQIDQPLTWMEETLKEISPDEEVNESAWRGNHEPVGELDGMLADLEDVEGKMETF